VEDQHYSEKRNGTGEVRVSSLETDCVRCEVLAAVTMKNAVCWDIKNPVRNSQETYYIPATDRSRLMLRKMCCFHGGDYEECHLLVFLFCMILVRTDVSEECIASITWVTRIGEPGTTLAVTSNRSTVRTSRLQRWFYKCNVTISKYNTLHYSTLYV
jgi:hypothetical protein